MAKNQAAQNLADLPTRDRVIFAARAMMQDESAKFSMRELAERAGVSLATPYNLFGSKQGIIGAVLDNDLQVLGRSLAQMDAAPLDAFFGMADVVADMLGAAPQYYRAGAQAFEGDVGSEMQFLMRAPRHQFIRNLVEQAVQAGCLDHRVHLDSLALALGQQFYGWIQSWAKDLVDLDEFRLRVGYGFALTLAGAATDDYRVAMQDRLYDYQQKLQALDQNIGDALQLKPTNRG